MSPKRRTLLSLVFACICFAFAFDFGIKCFCNFFHLSFFSLRFCMLFYVNKFSLLFYFIFYIKIFSFHLFGFTRVSFCQNLLHFGLEQWSESWRRWCRVFFSVVGREIFEYFFPTLTMAARAKKNFCKGFAHAISEHYRDLEHAYVYWIWLPGSASYVIMIFIKKWIIG